MSEAIKADPAKLTWYGDHGYYPAKPSDTYDQAYFDKYVRYAATELGQKLTAGRVELVRRHLEPGLEAEVIDVGIGCESFVEALGCRGFDVNPAGIAWLKERRRFADPYVERAPALTFWDSLEHLEDFTQILWRGATWVFVALPIFLDKQHVLRSKHFRHDEHYLYYTQEGLVKAFRQQGYRMVEHNCSETQLGREGIETFVFKRVTSQV